MMHLVYSSEQHQFGNFKKKTNKPTNTALSPDSATILCPAVNNLSDQDTAVLVVIA